VYDASLTHPTDIISTSAKAATNLAHVLHLPQNQTKTMHMGNAFLPWLRQKVSGGGENSPPPNPPILDPIGLSVMSSHTAPSADHTRAETIPTESSNHELIDGIVSALGGVG
jgi:hypothetical protein